MGDGDGTPRDAGHATSAASFATVGSHAIENVWRAWSKTF